MEIGTIGAGAFAQAFAKRALKAGHKVKLSNSRGPDSLGEIVNQLGPGTMAATKEEAAACEMVLLAVPWDNVPETLASLPKWKNQILIDGTNPFHGKAGDFTPADVGNLSTSQLMLIRLFQQTPRGSVIGWLARRFPKPCANFSRTSPPKRLVESTWPPAAGRMVLCVLDAGTGVLMNW